MKNARLFIAGAIVGLCFCAIASADDGFPFHTQARPVVVKRVIVVSGHQDRVIYVGPAYSVRSVVPVNRSEYLNSANQTHKRDTETSASIVHDGDNHVVKPIKTSRDADANQAEQQADKESPDRKPEAAKPVAKQPEVKRQEPKAPEDAGALDRLTVQAQKEEAMRLSESGGIEPR